MAVIKTFLKDYTPYPFNIDSLELDFDIWQDKTVINSKLSLTRCIEGTDAIVLDGEQVELESITLNGRKLTDEEYTLDDTKLIIPTAEDSLSLEIRNTIDPVGNTSLSGLYKTKTMYCTQCEAEGFRRITFFPDRPDVMTYITTTIHADKNEFPVLLSNGNIIGSGLEGKERHWVRWQDPSRKPCYLFALVAGNLIAVEDNYITQSGNIVKLRLFVEHNDIDKTLHAMRALQKAMHWDEVTYNLEYDLEVYMTVATHDFNMGAMENKGLNIFNASCILANPRIATDDDYRRIDDIVAHEYFHNWTGNRITCREWFQLSLKEGLTVFRENQFSADISQDPATRINQVRIMINYQFLEDQSPMKHPVQPTEYLRIDNFYTLTIYDKGAEVIRMLSRIVSEENFYKGMAIYFEEYDGMAVTIEELIVSMEKAAGMDLQQFRLWYSVKGTPKVYVDTEYDASTQEYKIKLRQEAEENLYIPIEIGLLEQSGNIINLENEDKGNKLICLQNKEEEFSFSNISSKPVLALGMGFSAPVQYIYQQTKEELDCLLSNASDSVVAWQASQRLFTLAIISICQNNTTDDYLEGFANLFTKNINDSLLAELITPPSLKNLLNLETSIDIELLNQGLQNCKQEFAKLYYKQLNNIYTTKNSSKLYVYEPEDVMARKIKNVALKYLVCTETQESINLAVEQINTTDNMTDTMAALACLNDIASEVRTEQLNAFYKKWQHEDLVVNKWLRLQATTNLPDSLTKVKQLTEHPAFNIKNPNKVYALIGAYSGANLASFHTLSGAGYSFLADKIIKLDDINPQVAARLIAPLTQYDKLDEKRQELMKQALIEIKNKPNLSPNILEYVEKCLN